VALPVWIDNLIAYSLQIAILTAAGTLLAHVFRLRMPGVALVYWQSLLMGCLFVFALQEWRHPVLTPMAGMAYATAGVSLPAAATSAASQPSFRFEPEWIGWILAAGIFLRLIWLALGLMRLRFFRRHARKLPEEPAFIQELQSSTRVRASLLYSDEIDTPVTFGIQSPAIILPAKFSEMDEDRRRAVLCHELLHIRRRDWLFIIVEEAIRAFFWFHPAIWWLLGRIRLSREQAVDYDVVRLCGNRQSYLDSLLEFARAQGRPKAVPAPLFLKERHLVQRVALLLREVSMSRSRLCVSIAVISILLIGTVRLVAAWFPLTGEPVPAPAKIETMKAGEALRPAAIEKQVSSKAIKRTAPQIDPAQAKPKKVEVAANVVPVLAEAAPALMQEPEHAISTALLQPLKVGGNVQESKLISRVEPVYPELAKRARVSGRVIMVVTANEEGVVTDVRVTNGHPLLVDAAVSAVKQWRYSPTLLNGAPVPVTFAVTCIFQMMGDDVVFLAMDQSGNLNVASQSADLETLIPKMVQGGMAQITIDPATPIRVAERAVQGLQERGVKRITLSGLYMLYQGRLFYTGKPTSGPQLAPDLGRLRSLLEASWQSDPGKPRMFRYMLFINEVGEIVGVERQAGPDNPEIDRELMGTRVVAPAMLGADPIPIMYPFEMAM
jgi:TonB family protein